MAKLIGTAGHVDHGKTTLIRALTGIDADRLPEEKARGMTIDIGFAHVELPRHGRVSIVDVPGHERFIANMLVGALGIDVALLCVAADEGVKPQTREHVQILDLLPVDRMVVAITRADLVDDEMLELAKLDVAEFLDKTRFAGAPMIAVSATEGTGIEELRVALSAALDANPRRQDGPWFLPIDRAFVVKGQGVVVTGTFAQGTLRVGDRAVIQPGNLEARVRSIHSHGEPTESAEHGRRIALNLSGVKIEDVERGKAIGAPGALFETTAFDAQLRWINPPKHGTRVRVSVGAEEAIGKVFLNDKEPELAQVRLESSIACALDQPVVLRRYSPPDLLGGGRIVVPQAKRRRKSEAPDVVRADDDSTAVLQVLGSKESGVTTDEVCRTLGKSPQALGSVFEKLQAEGKALGFAGIWFSAEGLRLGVERLLSTLLAMHEKSPLAAYLPREQVTARAGLPWAGKPLDRLLSHFAQQGILVVSGTTIRHPDHRVKLTDRQEAFLKRVEALLLEGGVNTPPPFDLSKLVPAPTQAVDEILRLGVEAGRLVKVADNIFYTSSQVEDLKAKVREASKGKPFAAGDLRDALGTTRKYIIPLLEYFDLIRFTVRTGDTRAIRD